MDLKESRLRLGALTTAPYYGEMITDTFPPEGFWGPALTDYSVEDEVIDPPWINHHRQKKGVIRKHRRLQKQARRKNR